MKQKMTELKGIIDKSETILRGINTPLSVMDRTTRNK